MKYKELNPIDFGLNKRVKIVKISKDNIGIVKARKSRIIMKDGIQISELASIIILKDPGLSVSLIISGPICSKTISYLDKKSINVITLD